MCTLNLVQVRHLIVSIDIPNMFGCLQQPVKTFYYFPQWVTPQLQAQEVSLRL